MIKMKCKLLSLDTSSSSTGWAFFIDGEYKTSNVLVSDETDSAERLKDMVSKIIGLISVIQPDIVVIETPVVIRNPQVQRMLTMIFGAVYGKCISDDIEFQELRPTEWRKLIEPGPKPRKRDELKEWSKVKAKELFNVIDISDDVSDAILIGQAYVNEWSR